MKLKLLIISILCLNNVLLGQDSIRVETVHDNFVPPQYLGEYDYLFMRHEAKSSLWKLDFPFVSTKPFPRIAYEKRFSKGFSLEISSGLYKLDDEEFWNVRFKSIIGIAGELRWYVFKKNEIDKRLSNNNLEGFYIGGGFEKLLNIDPTYQEKSGVSNKIAKELFFGRLGFQKRFLYNKYFDFGLSLGSKKYHWDGFLNYDVNELDIQWRAKIGWLLNGSKKRDVCSVLRCFEEPKSLFKIDLLNVIKDVYSDYKRFTPSVAYEYKMGESHISVNTNFILDFEQIKYTSVSTGNNVNPRIEAKSKDRTIQYAFGVEPRWYFLMKTRIAKGKQANNLNGFYTAVNLNYFSKQRSIITDMEEASKFPSITFQNEVLDTNKNFRCGIVLGYQQALSNSLFYEIRTELHNTNTFDGVPSALNFKLGLAF